MASLHIVHGDLKDENVLVEPETLSTKLIDFGAARIVTDGQALTGYAGTDHVASPEASQDRGSYDAYLQEVWSLGVVLYIMLTGTYPFVTPVRERHAFKLPLLKRQ